MKALSPWRLLLYGAFLLIAGGYAIHAFRGKPRLEVGSAAPDVQLVIPGASKVALGAPRDRVVVLSFWASWCDVCRSEVPTLNRIEDQGLAQVIGISLDDADHAAAQKLGKGLGMNFAVVGGQPGLARTFLVEALPTVYVIAPDGTITFAHSGVLNQATLEEAIAAAQARRI